MVTENVAVLEPAATVTLTGTVATLVRLLERLTLIPPVGAGPLRVTVPVDGEPPCTVVGLSVNEDSDGADTVNV